MEPTEVIERIFGNYLTSNCKSSYGFYVNSISSHRISATLKLLTNETYCCAEATCHLKPNWEIIRSKANVLGLILATPLSMEVVVLVERGAKIETNKFIGKPLASEGFTYIEQYNEKT